MEAEGSGVQDHPQQYSEFEANMSYMRSCLLKNKKKKERKTERGIKNSIARLGRCDGLIYRAFAAQAQGPELDP